MKKILVFNLTPRLGMLHYSSQFSNELAKGSLVGVVIADYYDGFLYDKSIQLFKIKTDPSPIAFIFNTLAFWRHFVLLWQIIRFKPNIVHFIDNHPWYVVYSNVLKVLGLKIFVTQHDPIPHSGESSGLHAKIAISVNVHLAKIADRLVLHSQEFCLAVSKKYQIATEKIVVVPHGTYDFFTRWEEGLPTKRNAILFFGRIVEYKGLDVLLESLAIVTASIPDVQLFIVGSGDISKYTALIERYKQNITLVHREILDNEVHTYFETCELVVLPYLDATASGIIPIAYAFGKPVLATNVGALKQFVVQDITGCLVEPGDVQKLGNQIQVMLNQPQKLQALGVNARKWSEENLGWGDIVAKIYPQ